MPKHEVNSLTIIYERQTDGSYRWWRATWVGAHFELAPTLDAVRENAAKYIGTLVRYQENKEPVEK